MHCIGGEWPFVLMRARHGASWRTFQETSFVQLDVATEGFNRAPMEMLPKTRSTAGGQVLPGEVLPRLEKHSCDTHNVWGVAARSMLPVVMAMWKWRRKLAIHRLINRRRSINVPQTASGAAFSGAAFWQTKEIGQHGKLCSTLGTGASRLLGKSPQHLVHGRPRRFRPLEPISVRSVGANHRLGIETRQSLCNSATSIPSRQ
jgi:hypothetical protein